jgi:DNA-directed RNA polymerase subunit RPC12/RpoP
MAVGEQVSGEQFICSECGQPAVLVTASELVRTPRCGIHPLAKLYAIVNGRVRFGRRS